eukprot:TRINITY_DN12493_c0_g2_i1.p2 TRINITY_DN12493_c0_g2~~TRINITY_DN12493_c0_g2_i1.p2  ORF type:complete len:109 (+),score=25.30 TRINITY_DN12493_c0_g2_i1:40-366(+)
MLIDIFYVNVMLLHFFIFLVYIFFFFKQKTAYEMLRSLVGSEMCIRDSDHTPAPAVTLLTRVGTHSTHYQEGGPSHSIFHIDRRVHCWRCGRWISNTTLQEEYCCCGT